MNVPRTTYEGVVVGGMIRLNEPVELADNSRVHVTVVPAEPPSDEWTAALAALRRLKVERPIGSGGLKFSRDELYDRH